MRYIKRYNEDIDWEFDEEEINDEIEIGDSVILKPHINYYERTINPLSVPDKLSSYEIIKNNKKIEKLKNNDHIVDKIETREDGKKVIGLLTRWPWYIAEQFIKI